MRYGILIVLMLSCAAQAQQGGEREGGNHERAQDKARTVPGGASLGIRQCHEDIERLCKSVKPGQGRLGKCLKANAKNLSKSCKQWLSHGGKGHVDRAFQELDQSTAPVTKR